ncbi:unnamed protein product [Symbiodinium natans]|uniref:Pentatricopeptide repeat-containing protein, chloroplastic n=1 Tax=Symbiodinium natans TaxID=878477 RepID=A0A812I0I3_9DINO|nr:unnamed protein product [Symbiodinium natans]
MPRQLGWEDGSGISVREALSSFRKQGRWRPALQLLQDAKEARLGSVDLIVFNIALDAASGRGRWQRALSMIATERAPDAYSWNTLAGSVSKAKLWSHSLTTLDALCRRQVAGVVAYNTSISSLTQAMGWSRARSLLLRMSLASLQPDVTSCSAAVACAQGPEVAADAWRDTLALLESIKGSSLSRSIILRSSLMTCVSRASRWASAWDLMRETRQHALQCNVVALCAATVAAQLGLRWRRAVGSFEAARHQELRVNDVLFGALLSAEAGTSWARALQWTRDLRGIGLRNSPVLLAIACSILPWKESLGALDCASASAVAIGASAVNAAIGGCGEAACWQAAVAMVCRLSHGGRPSATAITYTAAAGACERGRQRRQAVDLLRGIRRARLESDRTAEGAAMALEVSSWRRALWRLAITGCVDSVMQAATMSTCGQHGRWAVVLDLLKTPAPSSVESVNVAIEACKIKSLWRAALALLATARERDLKPDVLTLSSTLGACAEVRQPTSLWPSTLLLLEAMALRQVRPNLLCWIEATPSHARPVPPQLLHILRGHRISWCLGALLQSQWRASASANYGNKWFTGPLSKFQALLSELVYNTQANLGGVGAEMRFCIGTQQLLTWQEFVEELAARETGPLVRDKVADLLDQDCCPPPLALALSLVKLRVAVSVALHVKAGQTSVRYASTGGVGVPPEV